MNQLTLWAWVKDMFFAPARGQPISQRPAPSRHAAQKKHALRKKTAPNRRAPAAETATSRVPPAPRGQPKPATNHPPEATTPRPVYPTKQALYDDMVRVLCARHNIRVKRWRTSMSGVAWEARYRDGSVTRFLESPQPKSPMSAAIFLHEVGHHVIGLGVYRPRCLEEYHAWMYSLEQMGVWGVEVTDRVKVRMYKSLRYAAKKAQRRGIRRMPEELAAFL